MSREAEIIESLNERLKDISGLCTFTLCASDLVTIREALYAIQAEDKTEKYKGMIESFECDFSLAVEQGEKYGLDELQIKIEQGNNKLLSDIELLKELSYGLRSGSLKIIQQPKKGGDPPIEE